MIQIESTGRIHEGGGWGDSLPTPKLVTYFFFIHGPLSQIIKNQVYKFDPHRNKKTALKRKIPSPTPQERYPSHNQNNILPS